MNEGILLKGQYNKSKKLNRLIIILSVIICPYFLWAHIHYTAMYDESFFLAYIFNYSLREDDFLTAIFGPLGLVLLLADVALLIVYIKIKKREFYITEQNIKVVTARGKQTIIPLGRITAIKPVAFDGLSIATTTGVYDFYFLENRYEIMKALNYLLSPAEQSISGEFPDLEQTRREAEKLIQLKELFDDGSLTEEEYLAQKKQILKF